jgi:hypothetical protein
LYGTETWKLWNVDQKSLKVLKCGAGEEGEDELDRSCEKQDLLHRAKEERNILRNKTICQSCVETAL